MLFQKRLIVILTVVLLAMSLTSAVALAQDDVVCDEDVVVQADDWLSKLADKFFGDILAFPAIAEATNAKAQADDSYATIEDVNLIEPGWKLCIPAADYASQVMGSDVSQEGVVELRIAWWGSQNRHDRTIAAIELYEQENPNVNIVYEFNGWEDHWTKLATMAAGGNLPDIIQQDYARISEWQGRGLIYPLDEFVSDGTFDFSNVAQANLDGGVIDGQLWAINLGTNSLGIAVDTDAFAAAGMDLPADDWTWDDFETICQEYTEKTGKWCVNWNITDSQTVKSLYLGYGQWVYSDDGKSLGYDDDQPLIDLMNRFLWLQDGGMMMGREDAVALGDQGVEANELVTGDAAMGYFWSNQLVAVQMAAGEDRNFRFMHLPRPADGCCSSNYVKPSMFFSVTANSQNPKEAAAFINWWTNSKEANEILFAERGVPVSTEVQDHLKPMLDKAQLEMFEAMARISADASPIRPPDPPGHADIRNNVYDPELRDPVLYGLIPAEEGVAVFREMASEILAAQE
jgi:multiple sugar transport system substrate-binding protein